jgi:hypothetical protein
MARVITTKTLKELHEATPQPALWPVCGECETEFVLRRSLVVRGGNLSTMKVEWTWVRDCKHRKRVGPDKIERSRVKTGRAA